MTALVFQLLGGIGLFLLGMVLLTDGLKAFAGEALRNALVRFTGTPTKAFLSGALVTVLVQSSSATTVTVIGFVSAGLLTFPQALGVVMGASLGTTGTSWLVSGLGLKVSLGFYALPLVGVGALMKLLGHGRLKALGLALAGFGLIFIGIETLQQGMADVAPSLGLADRSMTSLGDRLLVMVFGAALTIVMQSSSAAVATTLTALHTGTLNFEQAALLVIGAAIGTTVTGAMAAIGASIPARRTALAHVTFNLSTGLVAVALLPLLLWCIRFAQEHFGLEAGAMSLAAFHTLFIATGAAVYLPLVHRFGAWIERRLPDRGPVLTRHLDDSLLTVPAVALEASRRALTETAGETVSLLKASLAGPPPADLEDRLSRIQEALDTTQRFVARIPPDKEEEPVSEQRVAQMHAIDHLVRLVSRVRPASAVRQLLSDAHLATATVECSRLLTLAEAGLQGNSGLYWLLELETLAGELGTQRQAQRAAVLQQTAGGQKDPIAALALLDAVRWLERVGHHTWRVCNYLAGTAQSAATTSDPPGESR